MREEKKRGLPQVSKREHHTPLASRLSPLVAIAAIAAMALAGCGTTVKRDSSVSKAPPTRGGGYYLDDGPGDRPPADIDRIPDAVPRAEPLNRATARPYTVMGRHYTPMTSLQPYRARGMATWYGRRYHGKQTSSGEIYDMYAMTAAHTTLPIPSYARVTNLANGRSVVVRINDRGPFIDNRLIDLSYTAAHKLGILAQGSAMVEVETIIPGADPAPVVARSVPQPAAFENTPVAVTHAPDPVAVALPTPETPAAQSSGIFLQFGAFGSKENADNYLGRLQSQVDWLSQTLHVYARDGLFRVHAGPYANQAEAREAAERAARTLGASPLVLTR
ncbi:MAG: septal ring lytic transglycosylase RlpA family protein [Burkholderiales bacterium]|nr:septal ring lytic transglycosylase RlpA family protein [Burkholderiales bacterium]